ITRAVPASMAKVNGRASAMATAPLIPGMAPPMIPHATPPTMAMIRGPSSALAKPAASPSRRLTRAPSPRQPPLEDAIRDRNEEPEAERRVQGPRNEDGCRQERARPDTRLQEED